MNERTDDADGDADARVAASEFDLEIRRATHDDYDGVVAFTSDIWPDRGGDYIPDVYHDWLEDDEETGKKTFLAEVDGEAAGIVQGVMLTDDEAWFQGMRVAADHRRKGVSHRLNESLFEWAREQGATVARVMIFSWNQASLGSARYSGYEPLTEFRFAHPEPDPEPDTDTDTTGSVRVSSDPAVAWRYWTHSDAREHLSGLGLAPEESWAMRELTRSDFERFDDETAVFVVEREDGVAGVSYRTRTYDRPVEDDGEETTETWAEYGIGAWEDVEAARSLFAAIARDAAECGADETRVLIPETARYVSDAPFAGAEIAEEPDFVLGTDLTVW
ncbi:Acetyltransferase (GNAT) family protein [Natronorubrum sediminis]|uniref:Acetyltransferase (GNAT) family protein n=1 Tax=Natronorubrum sediminis TaxID=640943 RepID=A0A1H6G1V6_9EURY|nr:GNAT family N-acetyltransferase [Natronorubrum sediminis]SEH16590.1 Acetyltransferase (GNAT) family protein [Natronorubrum sediminis]